MSESRQRSTVIKALKTLDAMAVENRVKPGTPDVEFIGGWLELKYMSKWPKNTDIIVRIGHFTIKQRIWLKRRDRMGGNCWLLLQVGRQWLLFNGQTAAVFVGKVNRESLYKLALKVWRNGLNRKEFLTCLQK